MLVFTSDDVIVGVVNIRGTESDAEMNTNSAHDYVTYDLMKTISLESEAVTED